MKDAEESVKEKPNPTADAVSCSTVRNVILIIATIVFINRRVRIFLYS